MRGLFRRLWQSLQSTRSGDQDGLHQDFRPEEWAAVRYAQPYSMTSPERIVHLVASVKYVHVNRIPGTFVECGVWRGGSMMTVARTLLELGDTSRELYLFDTFEGMPPPSANDRMYSGVPAEALLKGQVKTKDNLLWAYSPISEVEVNLRSTGYPVERIHLIQGRVEDTIPDRAPREIALLRLDTDWYESTLHELLHLYPRLSRCGVLIVDDYGWWEGARKAVDEFFMGQTFKPLLHRLDNTGRSIVRT